MLTENDIIDILEKYFKKKRYKVKEKCFTNQQGIDLIVEKNKRIIAIEAKGETSSKPKSNRYGESFNLNQIKNHIGRAILKSLETKCLNKNFDIAIALPKTDKHFKVIKNIYPCLKKNRLIVFFITENREVESFKG